MSPEQTNGQYEAPIKTRNPIVRLSYMRRNQGFMPANKRELADAYDLILMGEQNINTSERLRAIRSHQLGLRSVQNLARLEDREDKADEAVKEVIGRYVGYHGAAHSVFSHLSILGEQVSRAVHTPSVSVEMPLIQVTTRNDLSVRYLMRYADLLDMTADGTGHSPVDFNILTKNYESVQLDQRMSDRVDSFLDNTSLGEAWELLDGAMVEQSARSEFWNRRLVEANPVSAEQGLGRFVLEHP